MTRRDATDGRMIPRSGETLGSGRNFLISLGESSHTGGSASRESTDFASGRYEAGSAVAWNDSSWCVSSSIRRSNCARSAIECSVWAAVWAAISDSQIPTRP